MRKSSREEMKLNSTDTHYKSYLQNIETKLKQKQQKNIVKKKPESPSKTHRIEN